MQIPNTSIQTCKFSVQEAVKVWFDNGCNTSNGTRIVCYDIIYFRCQGLDFVKSFETAFLQTWLIRNIEVFLGISFLVV